MRFLIISCSLMIALPSVVLATKRPAECVFGPVLNYQNKKSCVGDEQRVSLEKLRKMIVENPEKIKKSVIFQNQIVEFCYDSALTLPIDKIVSLLPNLAQEAYLNHQYALMFI